MAAKRRARGITPNTAPQAKQARTSEDLMQELSFQTTQLSLATTTAMRRQAATLPQTILLPKETTIANVFILRARELQEPAGEQSKPAEEMLAV